MKTEEDLFEVELVYYTSDGDDISNTRIASATLSAADPEEALVFAGELLVARLLKAELISDASQLHVVTGSTRVPVATPQALVTE